MAPYKCVGINISAEKLSYSLFQHTRIYEIMTNHCQLHSMWGKVLDKVDHSWLTYKLKSMEFSGNMISRFKSYLTKRKEKVFFNSKLFSWRNHILALLRLLNDRPTRVRNGSSADVHALQSDLNGIASSCCYSGLLLKRRQCKKLFFSRCDELPSLGSFLDKVSNFNDLGVVFEFKLIFSQHIVTITNKANSF